MPYPIARMILDVRAALAGRVDSPPNGPAESIGTTTKIVEGETVNSQPPLLWYPKATKVEPGLPTLGRYAQGYPRGAVVHFTAGAYGLSELDLARQLGYAYFLIDEHGGVHQGFPLDRWGSHAGRSTWPSLGPNGVSRHLVGIEVDCAGTVKPDKQGSFRSWWGMLIDREEVRVVPQARDNQIVGAYHKFTDEQETALIDLLVWLKMNAPTIFDFDLVLGHDEVSPGRKQDPGGALSMPMPTFRALLERRYREAVSLLAPAV